MNDCCYRRTTIVDSLATAVLPRRARERREGTTLLRPLLLKRCMRVAFVGLMSVSAAFSQVRSAGGNISLSAEVAPRISLSLGAPSPADGDVSIEQQTESQALLSLQLIGAGTTRVIDVPLVAVGNVRNLLLKASSAGEEPLIISLSAASWCQDGVRSRALPVRQGTVFGMVSLLRCGGGLFAGTIRLTLPATSEGEDRTYSIRIEAVRPP